MPYYIIKRFSYSPVKYKHIMLYRDIDIKINKKAKSEWKKNTEKTAEAISRAKSSITELALNNKFDFFCTFSFDSNLIDRYDLNLCYKRLRQFFNNFKKRYATDFKWLIIPEFHEDGAIHFHGLVSGIPKGEFTIPKFIEKRMPNGELKKVPNTPKYYRWERYSKRFGRVFDCSPIKSAEKVAFYITKYVNKDLSKIPVGVHLFAYSRGLKKADIIYKSNTDKEMIITPSYKNDFCKVAYDKYDGIYQVLENCANENCANTSPFYGTKPEEQYSIIKFKDREQPQKEYRRDYGTQVYNEDYEVEYEQEKIHSRI